MRRLLLAKHDLDWLPRRYRYVRGAVMGSFWTVIGGSLVAATVWGAHVFLMGKGLVVIGTGGQLLADRVAKRIVRGRLGKLASGKVDLARLSNSEDGDLVHLRGTVRALEQVPALLGGAPGVYRRVRASFAEMQAIEEVAVDFQLVDADGNAIGIETEGARWLVNDGKQVKLGEAEIEALAPFAALAPARMFLERRRDRIARGKRLSASHQARAVEAMLRPGDEVEVVGYKSRRVDLAMADRMFRETPMRATLRAGKDLPLIISTVAKREHA